MKAIWNGTVIAESDETVDGERSANAAWVYPEPEAAAQSIEGCVAGERGSRTPLTSPPSSCYPLDRLLT